jgi:hypothetical protein
MKGHLGVTCAVGAIAMAFAGNAFAQNAAVYAVPPPVTTAAPPLAETATGYSGPNRALIGTGLFMFGLSYIPAVVVAGTSTEPADHHLYVPVAGPWLNLANRPACGPESTACDTETTNKVLIGVDGVFQGIGALTFVAGLLTPEHETVLMTGKAEPPKPSFHVAPAKVGRTGYGLAAFGEF